MVEARRDGCTGAGEELVEMWQVVWIFVFAAAVAWLEATSRRLTAGGLPADDAALWARLEALEQRAVTWDPAAPRSRRLPALLTLTAAAATVVVAVSDFFAPAGGSDQTAARA